MKKLLLIFTVLFLNSSIVISQDFWEIVNTPANVKVFSVKVNSNEDIFIGTSYTTGGGVYRSTDAGANWEFMGIEGRSIYSLEINEIDYIYAGSNRGLSDYSINRSIDNGFSWEGIYEGSPNVNCIKSYPGGLLFASGGEGAYGSAVKSTDYGDTWEEVITFAPNTESLYDIVIQNIDTIYIGTINWTGGGGGVYRSVDGGDNWEHIGLTDHYVSSLVMNSSGDLFAGSRGHYSLYEYGAGVFKLANGQTEWEHLIDWELVTSMDINSEDDIYIGCSSLDYTWGGVRRSKDNGQTWEDISLEAMYNRDIEGLALGPEEHLYALEHNSPTPIYKSVNSTITSLPDNRIEAGILTYNYPNPFSDETTLYFKLPQMNPLDVQIAIYNSQGNKIQNIILPTYWENEQSIKWNPKELPAGMYYYKITAGSSHAVKKMVLQK